MEKKEKVYSKYPYPYFLDCTSSVLLFLLYYNLLI